MKIRLAAMPVLLCTISILFASCGDSKKSATTGDASTKMVKVTQVMSWFAEPELGGQYTALAKGFYKEAGLDMTIMPGGPSVSSVEIVASGKAQFGVGDADGILLSRKAGVPVVAISAVFQKDPQVLVYHADDTSITGFGSLNGHTVFISPGAPYWEYLKKAYKLDKVNVVAYTGQLSPFIANKTSLTQGYITSEPYALKQQGVNVKSLLIYDSGYQTYGDLLYTTEEMIKDHPDVVKRYVAATLKGWLYYKDHYEEINKSTILKANPDLTRGSTDYGAQAEMSLIFGGDAATNGIGTMSTERWNKLGDQLKSLDLIPTDMDISKAYTTAFLPAKE